MPIKIFNLFYVTGAGYRLYMSSFSTREKAMAERERRVKQGRGFYRKSNLLVRVGKLQ